MYYVGIDVAKYKHTCFIASDSGEIIYDSFDFDNSNKGFSKLKHVFDSLNSNQLKIGFESTGHYSANLKQFLKNHQYSFTPLNAYLVKRFSLGLSIRKTKTDKIDAGVIARFLMTVDAKSNAPLSYHISFLKSLSRHDFRLNKFIQKSKVELVNLIDQAFPEFPKLFSSLYGKTPLNILKFANSLDSIKRLSDSRYQKLKSLSHGKFGYPKFIKLKELAKHSVGVKDNYLWLLIHLIIKRISFLEEERDAIQNQLSHCQALLESPILSIPGVSLKLAAVIIAEIGDVSRFPNYRSLIAYAGLDNAVYQSGNSLTYGRISKHGSVYLRTALFKASTSVILHTKLFYDFYHKKRLDGKHHTLALVCVSRKLLRVIYSLIKNDLSFFDH
jgi:transposase